MQIQTRHTSQYIIVPPYKKNKEKKKRFSRKKSFGRINFRGQLLLLYFTGSNFRVNTPNSGNSRYFLSQKFLHLKYSTQHVLHMLISCLYFHLILWISSVILSTKFDNDFAINLALSLNCNLNVLCVFINAFNFFCYSN